MNAYHFCAEFNVSPGVVHIFDGVVTSDADVLSKDFYLQLKTIIAGDMDPPRPVKLVILRSLSRLNK